MKKQIKDYEKGMNNYKFSIDVDAWIDGIEIEAHNIDEAKEKLSSMELEELILKFICKCDQKKSLMLKRTIETFSPRK